MNPLAYPITFTSYGTWLHGDERCWVVAGGTAIRPPDAGREQQARAAMVEGAVIFSDVHRAVIEQTIRDHCLIRGWTLHAANVCTTHVHLVVTADRHPDEVMNQLKAWCSRKLSDAAGLKKTAGKKAGRKKWVTEHGSTKWISDPAFLTRRLITC